MGIHKKPKAKGQQPPAKDKPRVRVENGKVTVVENKARATPAPSYSRQFEFSASASSRQISPLIRKGAEPAPPRIPTVFYTPEVWDKLWFLVGVCSQEVGWLGLVDTLPSGDFLVYDIFVPEQAVHGAETDIDADAMTDLALELLAKGEDTGKLIYWGHSHVNMGVSPSGQDERQIDEYLNNCPMFIRGIYNKRGERKVDVFDRDKGVVFQCVIDRLYSPGLNAEQQTALRKLVHDNVHSYRAPSLSPNPQQNRAPIYSGKSFQSLSSQPTNMELSLDDDEDENAFYSKLMDPFYAGKP